jgi:tRNA threonylcarbamoyladenosine modification (KEOPS) complex Cgi121 subunit
MIVKGYLGKMDVEETRKLAEDGIYIFNSKCIIGKEHLEYAYKKAKESFEKGKNIANNFHIEIMLILTGRRQITTAIKLAGMDNADSFGAISEKDFELNYERDDSVLKCTKDKLKYLGIEMTLDEKPCDLAFENSALLELER